MEVAAITAGPVMNLTAIENVATDFPQAMIFGCTAMNNPFSRKQKKCHLSMIFISCSRKHIYTYIYIYLD